MKIDDMLTREMKSDAADDAVASRVLAKLVARPLPLQRRPLLSQWWPSALLNGDFAPAWPRVAALACAACFGIAIGLFSPQGNLLETRSIAGAATASETDVASLVFDAEPLTGARP